MSEIEVFEFTKKQAELCAKDLIRARYIARERIGLLMADDANSHIKRHLKTIAQEVEKNLPHQKKLSDPDYPKEMKELFEAELTRQYKLEELYREILNIVDSCKKTLNERFLESIRSKEDAVASHKSFVDFACERILSYELYEELGFEGHYNDLKVSIKNFFDLELKKN